MTPQKVLKTFDLIEIGVGHGKTFGRMVRRCMPSSGHGGPPETRVLTIFVFDVSAQIPNIEYFEVYGGLHALGGSSSFFS